MDNILHHEDITGEGMIFLLRETPVSNIVLKLSNTRYNLAGFYYETNVSGSRQIKVILTDLGNIGSGIWLPSLNLHDVLSDRLVSRAVCRSFINNTVGDNESDNKLPGLFREILAGVVFPDLSKDNLPRDSLIQEWMKYLLIESFNDEYSDDPTSISLINNVILDLSDTISNHTKDIDPEDEEDDTISIRHDFKTRYLLIDLGFFGDPIDIHLPQNKRKTFDRYLIDPSILIKSISLNFAKLYIENKPFSEKCVKSLHLSDSDNKLSNVNTVVIQNLMSSGHHLTDFISSSINIGVIDPTKLINIMDQYKHDSDTTVSHFSIEPLLESNHDVDTDLIKLVSVCPSNYQDTPDVSPIIILTSLRDKINSIVESISSGETPILNINELSDTVNSLLSSVSYKLEKIPILEGETSVPSVTVISSGHRSGVPIRLSNGHKIILSLMDDDLERFDRSDLIEILSILDVMSDGDNRFDDMRAKIVDILH
jgi:hypothetical protein